MFPGSVFTEALSINDSGQIVGIYEDSNTFQLHGFLDNNGTFSTIDVPGSTLTEALSINNKGQIVGFYDDSSGKQHAFATNIDQALTTTTEAFNYTAGTGVAAAVNLGDTTNNATDNNITVPPQVISFQSFDSANFEPQSLISGLKVSFQGNEITITDSQNHSATITVDANGEESLSDPNNIFGALKGGQSIVLDVGYTIKDNFRSSRSRFANHYHCRADPRKPIP